jgi:hypothetical protein
VVVPDNRRRAPTLLRDRDCDRAPTGMTPLNGMAGVKGLTSAVGWQNLSVAVVGR